MQQIQIYCESEKIALALIGSDSAGVCMLMLGDQERLSVDQASILAANILLEGVINGTWNRENTELTDKVNETISKESLN